MARPLPFVIAVMAALPAFSLEYRSDFHLDRLRHSQERIYLDVVRGYDSLLARPGDRAAIHIEKCKFIEAAFYDAEEESNPKEADWDACDAAMRRLSPSTKAGPVSPPISPWG
jgi:hypothetical protein